MRVNASILCLGYLIIPATFVGITFEWFLGFRHDYVGHFAAGYGGTLCAMMVVLRSLPENPPARVGGAMVTGTCIVCIGLGAIAESTVFRIAKFDEIDFCNQSFGAVMAAAAVLPILNVSRNAIVIFRAGFVIGVVFLILGARFAFA